jgi:glutamyl-tRNA reductase
MLEEELDRALRRVKNGLDPNIAAEEMANRITKKILHPIIKSLKETPDFDVSASRREYEEYYIKKNRLTADHMNDVE